MTDLSLIKCLLLVPLSYDHALHAPGTVVAIRRVDAQMLILARYVRQATADEIKAAEQTPVQNTTEATPVNPPAVAVDLAPINPEALTNAELRAALTQRGIDFDAKANKTTLLALLASASLAGA